MVFLALSIVSCIALALTWKPKPQWPSMTVVAGDSCTMVNWRAGHDVAGLDAVDVGRDGDDAVRVVAGEVGVDAADGHRVRLLLRCAGGPQQRGADFCQAVGLDGRHLTSPCKRCGSNELSPQVTPGDSATFRLLPPRCDDAFAPLAGAGPEGSNEVPMLLGHKGHAPRARHLVSLSDFL